MHSIDSIHFRCAGTETIWDAAAHFYGAALGMRIERDAGKLRCDYPGRGARLCFERSRLPQALPGKDSFYWKIGIVVRNLDAACDHLRSLGVEPGEPTQFRDIGYLAHVRDPFGLPIELLQQGFEGHEQAVSDGHPIANGATLAHLTLRVTAIDPVSDYLTRLGMRLMSVQPVDDLGFTLYFYGWSDEKPPRPELHAVENREWLWARPYTLLELQYRWAEGARVDWPERASGAFAGFVEGRADVDRLLSADELADAFRT